MRRRREFAYAFAFLVAAPSASAGDISVEAVNASTATRCAETDNVYVKLLSPNVWRFIVDAIHPAYLEKLSAENRAPDFAHCDMANDPSFRLAPREVTLYDGGQWRLQGITYPSFWRQSAVTVRVGDRTESGLHLLQLWTRTRARNEEVLVFYPADGYWRARPLAPKKLPWKADPKLPTAYGSSFLIGPIDASDRPFVDISTVTFDPYRSSFDLEFARGGKAELRVKGLDSVRITLNVALSSPITSGPFAALRSMYVSADNADAAKLKWQLSDGRYESAGIQQFNRAPVRELWAGREIPSHHNTSAPDMIFREFHDAK